MATARVYLCPIVGDGTSSIAQERDGTGGPFRPKLADYGVGSVNCIPSILTEGDPDRGKPKFTWCLCVGFADSWTAVDADATCVKLFESADMPDTLATKAAVRQFLASKTVGSIPSARRTAIRNRLTPRGMDVTWITGATTLLEVFRYIRNWMYGRDLGDAI